MDSETIELAIEKATEYVTAHPLLADVAAIPLDQKLVVGHIGHALLKPDATRLHRSPYSVRKQKHTALR